MREKNNSRGITLIALIVTVIILLILVGVMVDILVDGELFESAKETSTDINEEMAYQQLLVNQILDEWTNLETNFDEETDGNSPPNLNIETSNIERSSLTITANATDNDNDILQYTLAINNNTYGPNETNTWNITGLTPGQTYLYTVKVTDGIDSVTKIGKVVLTSNQAPTATVAVSNITSSTATIMATGEDDDGDSLQYTLIVNNKTYGPSTTNTWNITGLTGDTTYTYVVKITDGYDTTTKTGNFRTLTSNVAPVIATNSLNSRTATSFIINAKATDSNGDSLTYELYVSTSQNGTYTLEASSSSSQNTQIAMTASSLSNYTTYWWYITASDGTLTTTSSKQSTKTYCPGTGYTCTTSSCSGPTTTTCTTCSGAGTVTTTCTPPEGTICGSCDGEGGWYEECPATGTNTYISGWCIECWGDGSVAETESPYEVTECVDCGATLYSDSGCGHNEPYSEDHGTVGESCTTCDGDGYVNDECTHGYTYSHTLSNATCTTCNGNKVITNTYCTHSQTSAHRYCTHYTTTTVTSHSYCSHGYTSQHL